MRNILGEKRKQSNKRDKNFEYLGSIGYLFAEEYKVYNKNGFNNALYHYMGVDETNAIVRHPKKTKFGEVVKRQGKNGTEEIVYNGEYSEKKYIRQMVQNYPKKYPATIRIYRRDTSESGRFFMDITY